MGISCDAATSFASSIDTQRAPSPRLLAP
jgi:hypothetical protein